MKNKSNLIIAMAAAGMLTACSTANDDYAGDGIQTFGGYNVADLTPVTLDVKSPAMVTTKGTGTVGGVGDTEDNKWNSQELWVFMLDKGTVKSAEFLGDTGSASDIIKLYNNRKMIAPSATDENDSTALGEAKRIYTADYSVNYYPMSGKFDFCGYHIDDAAINSAAVSAGTASPTVYYYTAANGSASTSYSSNAKMLTVPFKIDGTQDILLGTTVEPTTAQLNAAGFSSAHITSGDYYSGYSARKKVHPILQFSHKLSRFTFEVVAGDRTSAGIDEDSDGPNENTEAISVTGITMVGSSTGELILVNHTGSTTTSPFKNWNTTNDELNLKSKDADGKLVDLEPVELEWDMTENAGVAKEVGDAMMVRPGLTSYSAWVNIKQRVRTVREHDDATAEWNYVTHRYPITITAPDTVNGFGMGKSYKVKIWLYGLTETKVYVNAELVPWEDGGEIPINSDDDSK